jgi:hypothetical protein
MVQMVAAMLHVISDKTNINRINDFSLHLKKVMCSVKKTRACFWMAQL